MWLPNCCCIQRFLAIESGYVNTLNSSAASSALSGIPLQAPVLMYAVRSEEAGELLENSSMI